MNAEKAIGIMGQIGQQALGGSAGIQRLTTERTAAQYASNQRGVRQAALDAALKTAEPGEQVQSVLRRASFYEDYLFPKETTDGK